MAGTNELTPNAAGDHQLRLHWLEEDFLPKTVTEELFEKVQETSLVGRLAGDIDVVYGETVIPYTVKEPEAGQVGGAGVAEDGIEGGRKPLSGVAWGSRSFSPIKLAVIITASEEFVRQNPQKRWTNLRGKLTRALARAVDLGVFHGRSTLNGAALTGIDPLNVLANTTNAVTYDPTGANASNLADVLVNAYELAGEDFEFDNWAVDSRYKARVAVAGAPVDVNGNRQLRDINLNASVGSLLGFPAQYGKAVGGKMGSYAGSNIRILGGDFSQLKYGFADQVRFKVSDQATLTDGTSSVSMWQTNQVAIMAEATVGWVVGDLDAFVKVNEVDTP